jgi:REP element-mobilizing transposase RayT
MEIPMGSTHLSLHFHLIFGTKDHVPFIADVWRPRLHAYMGGILSSLDTVPEIVGGVDDHVHILAGMRATERLADVMRELKSASSRWVHEEVGLPDFSWQEGYGAFTVSSSHRDSVRRYIERQEEHHRTRSYKEEYLEFLKKCGSIMTRVTFEPPSPFQGSRDRREKTGG